MMGLTRIQVDVLAFITARIRDRGVSPSFAEIAEELDMRSRSGAHRVVHALIERGHLRQLPGRSRSLALAEGLPRPIEAGLSFLAHRTGRSREQLVAQAVTEFLDRQVQA
ncbi:MarR family transcriptional regulator [Bosea sp. 2KB_26]|uniref:LexA family protein n=1 Tax=Bosea sp. 2KB_26 TaxID=3237475 RepID=UPI003F91CEC2